MMGAESSEIVVRLGVAALGGLAVGIEREWSVKRGRHAPHFAGTRTFLLLGVLGSLAAELTRSGMAVAGLSLVIAAAGLVVAAYAVTSRGTDVGGTTEVAALIVLAAGVLAGLGRLTLASALFALTVLVLVEKSRFHTFVGRIESVELTAAARFAVLALVIFPLLPLGPFGPGPGLRPRELWALVLFFSGVSFASFILLRLIGLHRGYGLAGLLGGLISSTAVTLNFSRESRRQAALGRALALGVIAACAVLPLRVLALTFSLNHTVGLAALPYLLPPVLAGAAALALLLGRSELRKTVQASELPSNPLRLATAVQMVLAFQIALYVMEWMGARFGASGTLASAALVGLTDLDALTYSMIKLGGVEVPLGTAAQVLGVGVLSNTLFKMGVALAVGLGGFRRLTALGLLAVAAAGAAALKFF
ncbi:MAG: MgtC/SapB family protein [Candidatus Omnitrophica bacterium]|nr:MgtC/SapB family protein [Candidatus Omnitrophota bacterium]